MTGKGPEQAPQLLPIVSQPDHDPLQEKPCTKIYMPQLGESVTEGTVGAWLKQIGDRVDKYDPLVEVETDKVNTDIPSPIAGVIREIYIKPQTTIPVGKDICCIDEDELPKESTKERKGKEGEKIDLPILSPQKPQQPKQSQVPKPTPSRPVESPAIHIRKPDEQPRVPVQIFPDDEIIPLTPMRRLIAEHMIRSLQEAPQVTTVMEVDMTNIVALRSTRKEEFLKREGVDLTYLPFAIKATTLALNAHRRLNAVFDENRIIERNAINIGVAVALEDGLIVPVIKNADRLSIIGLAHEIFELADKARTGRLTPDDVTGGTFTVNNPGTFGTIMSTPILVQPQVAIIATEAIIKRPVVVDNMIAIRDMMNLDLTFDHRALDGLAAARFLQQVKKWLENVNPDSQLD